MATESNLSTAFGLVTEFTLTNETEDIPEEDDPFLKCSYGLRILAAVITIFIIIIGICGNVLTVAALIVSPRVRNVAATFIISLCVADLLFCATVMPFSVDRFIHGRDRWARDTALCTLLPLVQYANVGVSLLSIAAITLNRYTMIAHTRVYKRVYTKQWVALMLTFTWVFSYGLLIPTLAERWGKFGYDEGLHSCSIIPDDKKKSSKTALFVMGFLIPCLTIIVCYARIFWVVRSSERRLHLHADRGISSKKQGSEWRVTKMVLAIFLSFVVCYLPITIIKTADKQVKVPDAHVFSYVMIYFSACINPIIYFFMNRQYRRAYKNVLCCQLPEQQSSTSVTEKSNPHARTTVSHMSLNAVNIHKVEERTTHEPKK